VFPEVCKAIQTRRAQYSLLVKENHHIENMVHYGQIEEKDACQLREEIEKKLFYLTTHAPEINFNF
jgi:predicted transcriptional regulator